VVTGTELDKPCWLPGRCPADGGLYWFRLSALWESGRIACPYCGIELELLDHPALQPAFNRSWTTPRVRQIAQDISAADAFDEMAIITAGNWVGMSDDSRWREPDNSFSLLGDALEDAGCTNRDILDHCRTRPRHTRGCWVVDCILGYAARP
jgi:hypothetical protein